MIDFILQLFVAGFITTGIVFYILRDLKQPWVKTFRKYGGLHEF